MEVNVHPGVLYFYSETFGLSANGICAFIAALTNFGVFGQTSTTITALCFIVIGGAIQLLCSIRAFRAHDHFTASLQDIPSSPVDNIVLPPLEDISMDEVMSLPLNLSEKVLTLIKKPPNQKDVSSRKRVKAPYLVGGQ